MSARERRAVNECMCTSGTVSRTHGYTRRGRMVQGAAGPASNVRRVIGAIARLIPLDEFKLPDEFFPAHLSVALIDAVFHSELGPDDEGPGGADRYCRRFGIERTRQRAWELPPKEEQQALEAFVGHFDELGVEGLANEMFETSHASARATASVGYLLRAARAFRRIEIEFLQDVSKHDPEAIEDAMRSPDEDVGSAPRRLLMYTGDDDFVRGDVHVRQFVAHAIGRQTVSAALAEELVRTSAHELLLSPRFLDLEIWRYGASFQVAEDGKD